MSQVKGIAIGFVAGLAVAAGTIFLLRDEPAMPASDDARIAALSAQIERLERSVARLSLQMGSTAHAGSISATDQADRREEKPRQDPRDIVDQQKLIASADAMVDFGIQTGQWTRQQALELRMLTTDLPLEEQGRIHARISKAINEDRLRIELN